MAHSPHERLMAVDDRPRAGAVLVKPWSGHDLFDFTDGGFALGDLGFELVNLEAARLDDPLTFAGLGIGSFLFMSRFDRRRLRCRRGLRDALPNCCLSVLPFQPFLPVPPF